MKAGKGADWPGETLSACLDKHMAWCDDVGAVFGVRTGELKLANGVRIGKVNFPIGLKIFTSQGQEGFNAWHLKHLLPRSFGHDVASKG